MNRAAGTTLGPHMARLFGRAPVVFGLRAQGHLPTVERMLAGGASWDEIGRAIGWDGPTAQRFYEEYESRSVDE